MKEQLPYEIENVGGIRKASFTLEPGMNILRGRNAAGKSSAKDAIVRAQGGKVPIELRDGAASGQIVGPGVTVRVGAVSKRTGHAAVSLANTDVLGKLIDPGIQDTKLAARARVRALVELLGLAVTDEALKSLSDDDEQLFEDVRHDVRFEVIEDLMEAAEKTRSKAHALARKNEREADAMAGQAESTKQRCLDLLQLIGGPSKLIKGASVEKASEALEYGTRQHQTAVEKWKARQELEEKQAQIRETLKDEPPVEEAERDCEAAAAALEPAKDWVRDIEVELQRAKDAAELKRRELEMAETRLADTKVAADRWNTQQAILSQSIESLSPSQLETLKTELVDNRREMLNLVQASDEYSTLSDEVAEKERAQREFEELGKKYRGISQRIPEKLASILESSGVPGLTVISGRLHVVKDGEPLDFEKRLSSGERVDAALDVAVAVFPDRVVDLAGEYWMSLDPEKKAAFAQKALARGLYVLTEEPTEGELRIEHYEGSPNEPSSPANQAPGTMGAEQ